MSTASPFEPRRDWLTVGPRSQRGDAQSTSTLRQGIGASTAFLQGIRAFSKRFFDGACAFATAAASVLLQKTRELRLSERVAAVLVRLPRLGDRVLRAWRWMCAQMPRLRLAHPVWAMIVALIVLPTAYVVYCIATIPFGGGLVIEPTPSALVVEANSGQLFATRGVFKGDKLTSQDI